VVAVEHPAASTHPHIAGGVDAAGVQCAVHAIRPVFRLAVACTRVAETDLTVVVEHGAVDWDTDTETSLTGRCRGTHVVVVAPRAVGHTCSGHAAFTTLVASRAHAAAASLGGAVEECHALAGAHPFTGGVLGTEQTVVTRDPIHPWPPVGVVGGRVALLAGVR